MSADIATRSLYPQKQSSLGVADISAKCQKQPKWIVGLIQTDALCLATDVS